MLTLTINHKNLFGVGDKLFKLTIKINLLKLNIYLI